MRSLEQVFPIPALLLTEAGQVLHGVADREAQPVPRGEDQVERLHVVRAHVVGAIGGGDVCRHLGYDLVLIVFVRNFHPGRSNPWGHGGTLLKLAALYM